MRAPHCQGDRQGLTAPAVPHQARAAPPRSANSFVRAYIDVVQYYDADEMLRDARAYLAELEAERKRDPYAPRFAKKKPAPLQSFEPKVPAGTR